ncbi:MAG: hypothetical protein WBD20_20185 [Pirellulaceae bacterium]
MNRKLPKMTIQATWAVCFCFFTGFAYCLPNHTKAGGFPEPAFPEPTPSYTNASGQREDASLHAVAFASATIGLAVGDHGTLLRSEDAGATWQIKDSGVECRLDDVIWINTNRAIAVGGAYDRVTGISRGVVIGSNDGGQTWSRARDQELPRLRTVAVGEDSRTIVATGDYSTASLSREFESHDFGLTWRNGGELDGSAKVTTEPTATELYRWTAAAKVNTPIRDACRFGKSGLCAVGDHGVITQSRDGGKTWQTTRGADRHCAVLVFAATSASVPWPIVGGEAIEMRHRLGVVLCDPMKPLNDPVAPQPIDLSRQAAAMLGASGVDLFDASFDASKANPGRSSIDHQAVAKSWLSIHKPSVMVVDQSLDAATRQSLTAAAMSTGVQRIISYAFGGNGDSMIHSSGLLPSTGVLNRDLWQDALQIVAPGRRMPSSIAIRSVYDASGTAKRGESLLAGLQINSQQSLASPAKTASRRQLQIVQGRLAQPARITNLIHTSRNDDEFASGVKTILDQTAKEDQFRLAWGVLQDLQSNEQVAAGLQIEMLRVIADRFDSMSAGKWAALRLQSIEYGSEWSRLRTSLSSSLTSSGRQERTAQASEIIAVSPFQSSENRVVQASATSPLLVPKPRTLRQRRPEQTGSQIDLAWEFHPLVLIARHASRIRGDEDGLQVADEEEGSGDLRRLNDDPRTFEWSKLTVSAQNQRDAIVAKRAKSPPRLDGKLDESYWQLPALRQAGASRQPQIAYDDDFVYVAWQCPANMIGTDDFDRQQTNRVRDHDLDRSDRIELSIDTDQDLLTAMQFSATDAGRTHDAIDGHRQFDPTWYIAVDRDATLVSFEMAIQRRDVTDLPIVPGQSWLLRARCLQAGMTEENVMPIPSDWTRVEFR